MESVTAEKIKNTKRYEVLDQVADTEDMLIHLGQQLLDTPHDQWNIIIGDDAGARLPTHYVHTLLKNDGRDTRTFFVASSSIYRNANGATPYHNYFAEMTELLGEPMRPLVVTESVGSGGAVDFLRDALRPYSSMEPQFASVAVSEESRDKVDYAGQVGQEALLRTWHAYESPPVISLGRKALKRVWSMVPEAARQKVKSQTDFRITPISINETVGVKVNPASEKPIVEIDASRDATKSTIAYKLMEEIAARTHR